MSAEKQAAAKIMALYYLLTSRTIEVCFSWGRKKMHMIASQQREGGERKTSLARSP
jgi:hypothetical protein